MRYRKSLCLIAALAICFLFLQGCGSFVLPPVPTPSEETPTPELTASPSLSPAAEAANPAETAAPEPTPEPTPTPEDPDQPHLSIREETRPERVKQYDVFSLQGIVETDKGVIIELRGAILDTDGIVVQESSLYQPYDDQISLAGTVNADLRFGELALGDYVYQVVAVAENKSLRAREILIDQPFRIVAN